MKSLIGLVVLFGICCQLLCGCRTVESAQGFPHNGLDTKKRIKARYENFDRQDYDVKYYAAGATEAQKLSARDSYIRDRKALIDAEYVLFLQKLSGVKDWKDFGKKVTVGTMGVVGGLVGGNPAQLLSAASGATTLTDSAVDSVFFYNASMPAMKAGMDAARAATWVVISEGMTNSTSGYSLAAAEADMDNYYFAGTLLGASNQIQKDSASTTETAKAAAKAVKEKAALQTENSGLDPNDPLDAPKIEGNTEQIKALDSKISKFESR